jgi:hypothetical protein
MSSVNRQPGGCFQTRPPREFTSTPLTPRKSAAVDDSITITAGEDSSCHGGGGGLVTLSAFATVATIVGGRVATSSSVDSSDDEVVSIHLAPLFGVGVCDDSPNFSDHNDLMPDSPTDNEVSKYSFYTRLSHYMEGHKIGESNRTAVELCLLSEAGAFVCNMDPIKKNKKESAVIAKYLSIVDEIEDDHFEEKESVRENMRRRYKGGNKDNSVQSLWRKYKAELTCLRTFAKIFPGIGNLAELPSGSTQLRHMKKRLVELLWKEKYPVRYLFHLIYDCTIDNSPPICCDSHTRTKTVLIMMIHFLSSRK